MDKNIGNIPIGGYFELELVRKNGFIHDNGVLLNSGRNALEYVLKSLPQVHRLWIPYFTCEVVLSPLNKLGVDYSYYHIDNSLEIKDNIALKQGDYILYTNYFGIKDEYLISLVDKYSDRLIVDNAQAWYSEPINGVNTVYSPRKFVGIPDGGVAYCNTKEVSFVNEQDLSYDRFSHLIKRVDLGPTEAYMDFKENGNKLLNLPIRQMSKLTRFILSSIDFDAIKRRRIDNFCFLHEKLNKYNEFIIPVISSFACPMVYPFFTENRSLKKKLIDNKIFVATYWPNVLEWCKPEDWEYKFTNNTCFLPIDQRYGEKEMERIIDIINE